MPPSLTLTADNQEFCELVSKAAFSNPFTDERARLDAQITGGRTGISRERRLKALSQEVMERVRMLRDAGKADVRLYAEPDRRRMESVFIFDAYHRFDSQFDALILEQIEHPDADLPVLFAEEALALLARRGFTRDDSARYFALMFQLRRAFHFIDRGLIGQSESMRELRENLWNSVFTHDIDLYDRHLRQRMEDFSTLLIGETGTGKGAAAAAIGRSGFIPFDPKRGRFVENFTETFIALNLSQFPEALIESELFGHRKGAFTGAVENHQGLLERCSAHGSIFLDEIGDVSPSVQIKLLTILENRWFAPVGSHDRRRFRGRIIAATHRPLAKLRQDGSFREDFYYRLCSDTIPLPPLRDRIRENRDELCQLLDHLVARIVGENSREVFAMVFGALRSDVPADYAWPGNVRELEQAVRRILVKRRYQPDTAPVPDSETDSLHASLIAGTLSADELLSAYCRILQNRHRNIEEVARRTDLDRRTVKRYLGMLTGKHSPHASPGSRQNDASRSHH